MNIRAAVITVSDTRELEQDLSGNILCERLQTSGIDVAIRRVVTDDLLPLAELLMSLSDRGDIDLILTTGGTGLSPRDNTPEATRSVIEREVPGMAEAMRRETYSKTKMSMLSRGVAGVRGRTLIVNLPGSPKGVEECFEVLQPILQHSIDQIGGKTSHETK